MAWPALAELCRVALRLGYLSWGLIMMPLSRSLRRLCSLSHLPFLREMLVLAGSHWCSHQECCTAADAQVRGGTKLCFLLLIVCVTICIILSVVVVFSDCFSSQSKSGWTTPRNLSEMEYNIHSYSFVIV